MNRIEEKREIKKKKRDKIPPATHFWNEIKSTYERISPATPDKTRD